MEVVSGDNWSYRTCKAPIKSSPPINQCQLFTGLMPNQQCHSPEGNVGNFKADVICRMDGPCINHFGYMQVNGKWFHAQKGHMCGCSSPCHWPLSP